MVRADVTVLAIVPKLQYEQEIDDRLQDTEKNQRSVLPEAASGSEEPVCVALVINVPLCGSRGGPQNCDLLESRGDPRIF